MLLLERRVSLLSTSSVMLSTMRFRLLFWGVVVSFAKMLSRLKLYNPTFQAAIDDIDNALGTVKSWKSRPVPRDEPIHDLEFDYIPFLYSNLVYFCCLSHA